MLGMVSAHARRHVRRHIRLQTSMSPIRRVAPPVARAAWFWLCKGAGPWSAQLAHPARAARFAAMGASTHDEEPQVFGCRAREVMWPGLGVMEIHGMVKEWLKLRMSTDILGLLKEGWGARDILHARALMFHM